MFNEYIRAAMRRATYQIVEDDGSFYGSIEGVQGPWANETTLETCRDELQSVLEDWILIKLRHDDQDFPVLDGIDLNTPSPSQQEVA